MSAKAAERLLFAIALVALPVPILVLGPGRVPAAQIAELGLASLAFGLAERLHGVVAMAAGIFLGQAVLYAIALFWVARIVAVRAGAVRTAVVVATAALALVACFVRVYHTPYHATLAHATLLEIYR